MKTLTIGRDAGSDIVINDKMISRRHAVLRIYSTGKMELVDMSTNGTFVNGVKLASNVPFPVTRKNTVDFAHVKHLDWSYVPNPLFWVKWAVLALISLSIIIAIFFALMKYIGGSENNTQYDNSSNFEVTAGRTSSDGITTDSGDTATEGTVAKGTNESTDKDSAKSGTKNWYENELAKERNRKAASSKDKEKPSKKEKDSKSQEKSEENNSNNSVVF